MKITAIKAQVKNPDRVSVYVDDAYAFSLTHNQLLEQKLHSGLELDEAHLSELKAASEAGKLYDRLLRYVLVRPRSHREVEQYCRRKQYDPDQCRQAMERLELRGYLNDEAFARAWVESRSLTKAVSERRLRLELKQKGIDDEVAGRVLAASSYSQDVALQTLIAKKKRQARYQDQDKLLRYLVGQGFRYDMVRAVLEEQSGNAIDLY